MTERKLASVQRIKDLQPIPGADKIEVATVLGWQVVVKKGDFSVGDLVYFFEIDSWVPNTIAPFLSTGYHFRLTKRTSTCSLQRTRESARLEM